MFKFEKISTFDFNKLYESHYNKISLSLDDFDDNEDLIGLQTAEIKDDYLNFDLFLMSNVFAPIDIKPQLGTETSKTEPVRYAWKKTTYDGNDHYIAYIYILQSKDFHLYIDLNHTTKELYIGNCNPYKNSRFFTISYPLIKICEHYTLGPVYISDIYVDIPYGWRETPQETLNKIKFPLKYTELTLDISFYYCQWNGKKYYYPYGGGLKKNDFAEIDNNVKLSHNFIEHLKDFKNKVKNGYRANVNVYYTAFENWYDFLKLVVLLCEMGATIHTDFRYTFTLEDYEDKLPEFKELIEGKLGAVEETKQKLSALEEKCKAKIQSMFPQKVIDHFESIIEKAPNLLSTKTMFKERKSNDPYRKFDLPIVDLILKDNGIDVDKLVERYENVFMDNLYKFINTLDNHFDRINCDPSDKQGLFQGIFIHNNVSNTYKTTNGDKEIFDGITDEEVLLLKNIISGLKYIETTDPNGDYCPDKNRLDNKSDDTYLFAMNVISYLCTYRTSFLIDILSKLKNKYDYATATHIYNKFVLLQRFVYLFNKLVVDDHNDNISDEELKWKYPKPDSVYNPQYTYVSSEYHYGNAYYPLNFGDNTLKLNSYILLYKFLKMIAYIIENGYNITVPNLSCIEYDEYNKLLLTYGIEPFTNKTIEDEFNYDNKPNIDLLNINSISKMFQTIFTNIDKRL